MNKLFLILILCYTTISAQIYLDSTATVDARVNDLISRMTIQEKIGQMIQVDRGSITGSKNDIASYAIGSLLSGGGSSPSQNNPTAWANMYDDFQSYALKSRLKIPMIYGIDAVHGNNNVFGSTIFPHNIGLGCTNNEKLVRMADSIIALEVAATGIDWTFAPCIAVVKNERWGRTYEGFGETTELTKVMSKASVLGFQGSTPFEKDRILACAKHYLADGGTAGGANEGNSIMTEEELRRVHLPGYIDAINSGVGSVMASYSSWNGNKMHGHKYLLTDVLKTELGFKGFIVSDWAGIDQLPGSFREDVKQSINAGIDMVMIPDRYQLFASTLSELNGTGEVSTSRIDDAVKRILRKKFELGLFERPYTNRALLPLVGSNAHREIARQCVRESLVMLMKKDGILPLKKSGQKILVAGKNGNDIGSQCGGWTISWQGSTGNITTGTTIFDAIKNGAGAANVTYDRYASNTSNYNIAVVVVGETPYAESSGDRTDLSLDQEDITTIRKVKQAGLKTIVVIVSGRPMIINSIIPYSDAIIAAWLPGTEGSGVADILFGDYQPKGTLSHTWPKSMDQIPINFGDTNYDPLFKLGYGILSSADSAIGSAPDYYSSLTIADGSTLDIAFTKPMNSPVGMESSFVVKINNSTVTVTSAKLNSTDSKNITLTISKSVTAGDKVTIQYNGSSLKSADGGMLKPFGPVEVYNLSQSTKTFGIPGKIQAEDFISMFGVQTEATTDAGGGLNVGYIENGDWMEYPVSISTSGIYSTQFRVAAQSASGRITLKQDNQAIGYVDLPITGAWQNWQTANMLCEFTKGEHSLRVEATKGGFNLNWISFDLFTDVNNEEIPSEFQLYQNFPNPFNPVTTISYQIPFSSKVTLKIFDALGREITEPVNEVQSAGKHDIKFDGSKLSSGIYFYQLRAGNIVETKKFTLMK